MDGIINVYKERGYTSHDVVAKLRGILHMKKIGHTGTLDPDATGVLPVCVGKATKVCDLLTEKDKTYTAVVRPGITTDTYDLTGTVTSVGKPDFSEDLLKEVLKEFEGNLEQIPPMYSAIKVNGKKLYELARQGKEIERKPRPVTIYQLKLLGYTPSGDIPSGKKGDHEILCDETEGEFTIEVTCSKGTYIRSLCHDIGTRLGCGAAMKSLIRNRVGNFSLEEALTLSQIEECVKQNKWDMLQPVDSVFSSYPACHVTIKAMKFLQNGGRILPAFCQWKAGDEVLNGDNVRMYGQDGLFYALYRYDSSDGMFHIVKMFHSV